MDDEMRLIELSKVDKVDEGGFASREMNIETQLQVIEMAQLEDSKTVEYV